MVYCPLHPDPHRSSQFTISMELQAIHAHLDYIAKLLEWQNLSPWGKLWTPRPIWQGHPVDD